MLALACVVGGVYARSCYLSAPVKLAIIASGDLSIGCEWISDERLLIWSSITGTRFRSVDTRSGLSVYIPHWASAGHIFPDSIAVNGGLAAWISCEVGDLDSWLNVGTLDGSEHCSYHLDQDHRWIVSWVTYSGQARLLVIGQRRKGDVAAHLYSVDNKSVERIGFDERELAIENDWTWPDGFQVDDLYQGDDGEVLGLSRGSRTNGSPARLIKFRIGSGSLRWEEQVLASPAGLAVDELVPCRGRLVWLTSRRSGGSGSDDVFEIWVTDGVGKNPKRVQWLSNGGVLAGSARGVSRCYALRAAPDGSKISYAWGENLYWQRIE